MSVILAKTMGEDFRPDMVAGHSLGEFSALVAAGAMTFEDGLRLVSKRAMAMQKACEVRPSTMAAVLGLPDEREFSALVAAGAMTFEDGLRLVSKRAMAMQKACEVRPSTMAAVLGLPDEKVEEICAQVTDEVVVPANYNCPGQIVISGSVEGVDRACELLKEAGAKRALKLAVGGAFHSPLMEPAREELAKRTAQGSRSQACS